MGLSLLPHTNFLIARQLIFDSFFHYYKENKMSINTIYRMFLLGMMIVSHAMHAKGVAIDFDDVAPPISGFSQGPGGHVSGNVYFPNSYTDYGTMHLWSDWGVSQLTTQTPPDPNPDYTFASIFPEREMSAMSNNGAGGGIGGSSNYALAYVSAQPFGAGYTSITFQQPVQIENVALTNTNYAYHIMRDGDIFNYAKQFGGTSGNDPDYFYVTMTGKDVAGNNTGSVNFYLADYRFEDHQQDFVVSNWQTVNLNDLGSNVKSLELRLTTSDSSDVFIPGFGWSVQPNTPTYFAMGGLSLTGNPLGPNWNGGGSDNLMSNVANWGGAAPVSGQSMVFDGATNLNPQNDVNPDTTSFGAITFGSQADPFTLDGNALKLQYDLVNLSPNVQTVNTPIILVGGNQSVFTAMGDITINGDISESGGSFGITKTGSHTLTINGDVSYTGETKIEDGILQLNGNISNLNIVGNGDLSVGDGINPVEVTADSISVSTLTIAAGSKITIRPLLGGPMAGNGDLKTVPEPHAYILLALAALGLFVARRYRR
jgi:autotransporter-associated beta strand protein